MHTINLLNTLEIDLELLLMQLGYDVLLHMKNDRQKGQDALLYDKNRKQVGWVRLRGDEFQLQAMEPWQQLIGKMTFWDDSTKILLSILKAKIQYKKEFQGAETHFFCKGIETLQDFIVTFEQE